MKNRFSTEALIKKLKTNAFILNSSMPMGYVPNLPILCILNGNLCMKIPFLKYKVTGEIDKTFVYPTRYVATVLVPEEQVVAFEDLSLQRTFANVSFSDPIGTFRSKYIVVLAIPDFMAIYRNDYFSTFIQTIFNIFD